jgi:hypothetical protein
MLINKELFNHKNLIAFRQHGFNPENTSGENHVVGNCIFCNGTKANGDSKIFYINIDTKMWDCKLCGLSGGYKTFIEKLVSWSQENCTVKPLVTLSKNRSLKINTFRKVGIGFNPVKKTYLFPCYDINNQEILNVVLFSWSKTGKCYRAITAGGNQWVIGGNCLLNKELNEYWIVEGHWDYPTMIEIFSTLHIEDQGIISLPGALQFKDDLLMHLKGKIIHIVLHNDHEREVKDKKILGAGNQGMIKIYNKMSQIVESIDFVHWKKELKNGYDIRDLYIDNNCKSKETFDELKSLMQKYPPEVDLKEVSNDTTVLSENTKAERVPELKKRSGKGILPNDVYNVFGKWLELKTNDIIDVVIGCVLANRLPSDSVWLQIVGPSGSAKSVICEALDCHYDIEAVDTFTASTLVSGMTAAGGADPSLLLRLDKRILVTKDLTTILEMPSMVRDEIFGQLRSAFDGHYSKGFGNGTMVRTYNSKFGFIAGVTHAIEKYTEGHTALGERWIRFNIPLEDIIKIMLKMEDILQINKGDIAKKEMKDCMRQVFDFEYSLSEIEISEKMIKQLMSLAQLIEMLRGTVQRDRFSKEITFESMVALPTRVFIQLRKELTGICAFKRKNTPEKDDLRQIINIAKSTIPLSREHFLHEIVKKGLKSEVNLNDICKTLKLPSITVQRQAENLVALNVIEKIPVTSLKTSYKLTEQTIELIINGGMYSK